jgi:hypothetical protein
MLLGNPLVIQRRRNGLLDIDDIVVTDAVELAGSDAGLDVRADHHQHVRRQAAGNAHFLDFISGFQGYGHKTLRHD